MEEDAEICFKGTTNAPQATNNPRHKARNNSLARLASLSLYLSLTLRSAYALAPAAASSNPACTAASTAPPSADGRRAFTRARRLAPPSAWPPSPSTASSGPRGPMPPANSGSLPMRGME